MKHLTLFLVSLIFLSSCGGGPSLQMGEGGAIKLVVKGAASFNPNIEHGRIVSYRVTVNGSDMSSPVVAEFSGDSAEGLISGIPIGEDREVVVEAINPNDLIIRQGEKQNIKIEGGKVAQTEIVLESVPIFANIADGNTIDNTRLIFKVFSDPTCRVVVEELTDNKGEALINASTAALELSMDAATGLGKMIPEIQPPGQHSYQVKDLNTGRSSVINVILVDGTKRKAASFVAAGEFGENFSPSRLSYGLALLPFLQ